MRRFPEPSATARISAVVVLTSLIAALPLPFLPAQLLWLNLVTNGVQDVALAFEPGEPDVTRRPPRPPREGVISRLLWERTAIAGAVMAAGTLALFLATPHTGDDLDRARTIALTMMVIFQVVHVGNVRSEHRSIFAKSPFSNPILFAGWVGLLVTSLNLLPIGQLDGGHILYALLRKHARPVALVVLVGVTIAVIVGLAVYRYPAWILMLILLLLVGPDHPPTDDDNVRLGPVRTVLGWLTLAFIFLGLTPMPIIL